MHHVAKLGGVASALLLAIATARADVVTDWNEAAMAATAALPAPAQSRALAIMHGAMFDAVNGVEHKFSPYLAKDQAPAGAAADAAGAQAAHDVLAGLFPAQKPALGAQLASSLGKVANVAGRDAGAAHGARIAAAFLAARSGDGADAKMDYQPATGRGQWRPTPPGNAPMALPQWSEVKPFVLHSATQLTAKGPPALDGAEYLRDVDEVRRLGARNSSERTADQTAAAIFWVVNTAVPWNAAARALAAASGASTVDNARAFALMNMAAADAYIGSWAVKKQFNHWRPIHAIRQAASNADPEWQPLLNTPAHPDYPSGHCIYSGAAARALQLAYGRDEVSFTAAALGPNGLIRSYRSLSQMDQEVIGARIWGGIHFRTADEHGSELGHGIADIGWGTLMRPL